MKKISKGTLILLGLLVVVLGAAIFYNNNGGSSEQNGSSSTAKKASTPVPTLYVNGADASKKAANHLLTLADRDGGNRGLTIRVSKHGHIRYTGKMTKKTHDPLIKVVFDPKTSVMNQTHWLHKILVHLKSNYDYKNYNVVGFGGGAVAALSSASDKDTSIPAISQLISIGAGYNGIMRTNDRANANHLTPSEKPLIFAKQTKHYPSYQYLYDAAKSLPKNTKVLNIYGNSAGKNNNDGVITTTSAESLHYLVKERTDNYQAIKLTGEDATHKGLFDSPAVDRMVERSLFDKK